VRVAPAKPIAPVAPLALPGFERVRRYLDPVVQKWTAQVAPGELYVTPHEELLTTVLGSCVSVCMRDPVMGVGGMNHFVLPGDGGVRHGDATRYGMFALERLINELVKYGGERERFEIKLFGGGRVIGNGGGALTDIGRLNIDFVRKYLEAEGLPIAASSLGGTVARRVRYEPATGLAQVNMMEMSVPAPAEAEARVKQAQNVVKLSEIELFKR